MQDVEIGHREEAFLPNSSVHIWPPEDLEKGLKKAISIESRAAWGKNHLGITYCGSVQRFDRLYDLYADDEGGIWFENRILTPAGVAAEEEVCFSKRGPRQRK